VPVVHASSFLLAVPVVRDVLLLLGLADCSVAALRHTLDAGRCALVVPGGLQEALQPDPPSARITLVVKNKGMFRIALQRGVPVVPVFCFGEADIISGLPLPSFQVWAKRKLGLTYPQMPHGRLLLPLPRRQPVTVVVGACIHVQQAAYPTPADIDRLHRAYYTQLRALFERHKARCGIPEAQLVFADFEC
jgi:2-acylglycerol O-acyltransferase 2